MMRRFYTMILAMLATVPAAFAQTIDGVVVENYTMERSGNYIIVDMDLDVSGVDVRNSEVVVLTPHIVRDTLSKDLRSIGIYGRNRHFYYERNEDLAPTSGDDLRFRSNKTPDKVQYHAVVSFEEWMDGCQLVFEREDCGCAGAVVGQSTSMLIDRFPMEPYRPQLIYVRPEAVAEKVYAISGSAFVDFPVSNMDINPEYRNNSRELAKITGTIDSVRGDKDVTIQSIFIKGYASPESPYANNERLAKGRTAALKEYVENLYHFDEGLITTDYEPEDWAGLERYVAASNLKHKEEILATIHSEREPDNKEWWINYNWTDDYNFLLKNCYPALRHSDYTIEYTIRHYTSPREIEEIMNTAPQKLSLDEFYLLAQTYDEGSEELDELFEIAVRMYPNDEVANLNAANSAMSKGDYERALRYLERAGDRAEVQYARGALEVLREDYQAAMPYLEEAKRMGIAEAETTINAIQDYWKVSKR